jgi:hypothetical protein
MLGRDTQVLRRKLNELGGGEEVERRTGALASNQ